MSQVKINMSKSKLIPARALHVSFGMLKSSNVDTVGIFFRLFTAIRGVEYQRIARRSKTDWACILYKKLSFL